MAVTVGRIEYIVGADGHAFEKETRAIARNAGKTGGKVYSEAMSKEFRDQWAKSSGFEKSLGVFDKRVIAQFKRLGGFTSKAYATRFEKVLRPQYQSTVKKMVDYFNAISLGGKNTDLNRIFKGGPELEATLKHVKGILDELDFARRSGFGDKNLFLDIDIGALNRLRKNIEETIDAADWDLVGKKQLALNDAIEEGVGAIDKYIEAQERRLAARGQEASEESREFAARMTHLKAFNKLNDEMVDDGRSWLQIAKDLNKAAAESVELEEERARLQIRERRHLIAKNNLTMVIADAEERAQRTAVHSLAIEQERARVQAEAINLPEMTAAIRTQELWNALTADQVDQLYDMVEANEGMTESQAFLNIITEEQRHELEQLAGVHQEITGNLQEQLKAETQLTEAQERAVDATVDRVAATRRLAEAQAEVNRRIDNQAAWRRYLATMDSVEDAVEETRAAIQRLADEAGPRAAVILDRYGRRLVELEDASRRAAEAALDQADAQRQLNIDTEEADRRARAYQGALADIQRLMGNQTVWRQTVENLGSVQAAVYQVQQAFQRLNANGPSPRTATQVATLNARLQGYVAASTKAAAANVQTASSFVKVGNAIRSTNSAWSSGGNNVRHFGNQLDWLEEKFSKFGTRSDLNPRAIAGIVAVLGEPIAVLAGSLGPALIAAGGALTALVAGVGGAVAVFATLFTEVEKLPPDLRQVATEFRGLGQVMQDLKLDIARAAFAEMEDTFPTIGRSLQKLTPEFEELGRVVGELFDDFAQNIKPGTEGFEILQATLRNAAPLFESLTRSAGRFIKAFLDAFNRADPVVQRFVAWISTLSKTFEEFVEGPGFDEWMSNGMTILTSLSGLLDAVGTSLNNLVNPESVARTAAFIDNLAEFTPHLENVIAFFGKLDVLGLVSELLVGVGDAFANLQPALFIFADLLREDLSTLIAGMADSLSLALTMLNAIVVPLALFLAAMPPPLLYAIGGGLVAIGAGFLAIKTYTTLIAATAAIKGFMVQMTYWGRYGGVANRSITGVAGALKGLGGVALAGVTIALGALNQAIEAGVPAQDELRESLRKTGDAVKVFEESFQRGGAEQLLWGNYADQLENLGPLLDKVKDSTNEWLDLSFNEQGAVDSVRRFGAALGDLANTDLPGASQGFLDLADKYDLTGKQTQILLDQMGPFRDALVASAEATLGSAEGVDLLAYATKLAKNPTKDLEGAVSDLSPEMEAAAEAAQLNADALEVLTGRSVAALEGIEGVTEGITTLGSAFRDQEDANIGYHQSIEDVRLALEENGRVWDITTQAGRDNRSAIMDLAQSTLDYASEIYNMTGSQEAAAAAIQAGRDEVIKSVEGMDLGGLSAEEYADKLGLIPGDVTTLISANTAAGMEMADAFAHRLYELGLLEVDPTIVVDTVVPLGATAEVLAAMTDLEREQYIATLSANNEPALAATAAAMATMTDLELETFIPKIDADNSLAVTKTNETTTLMTDLEMETFIPKIDADNLKAKAKTKESSDQLYALDASIFTPEITAYNQQALNAARDTQNALNNVKDRYVSIYVTPTYLDPVGNQYPGMSMGQTAMGGSFDRAQIRLIAEDGPEAVVPLDRPLSRVDPSVRALSAFAQGLTPLAQRLGGPGTGTGRVLNIAPGAIQIQGTLQPEATATNVVNRIAERLS